MSVCQRKTGGWLVKFKDAATGKWLQRQFKSRELAEKFDASARIAVAKEEPISLREAIGAYLQGRKLCDIRVRTYARLVGENGPARDIADCYASSLTRRDLEAVRSSLRASGAKTTTINCYVGMLKAVLAWCASEDLIPEDPWAKYRSLPGGRTVSRDGKLEDLMRVYAHIPEWLQWAVRTAMALCLRPGLTELFAITWECFDFSKGIAEVFMPKVQRTKTVFLPDWYVAEARARRERDMLNGNRLVCRTRLGRAVRNRQIYHRPWHRACLVAGVSLPFYAIRHIVASEMLASGADIGSVAAQLGHSNPNTTAQFYIHAIARGQREAARAIPAVTSAW